MSSIFSIIREIGVVDSVAIVVMILFLVSGFRNGASGEVGSMLAWLITAAFFFFGFSFVMSEVMSFSFLHNNPNAAHSIGFLVTLFVSIAIWFILRKVLTDSIGMAIPTPFDEILGTFFGALKAILLIAFLCVCGMFDSKNGETRFYLKDSITIKLLNPVISKITQR